MEDEEREHRPNSVSARPHPDESFAGYVLRLTRLRRFGNWKEVGRPCGLVQLTRKPTYDALVALSRDARVPVEELKFICQGSGWAGEVRYMGRQLPPFSYRWRGMARRRVCPACLDENPYHRAIWDIVHVNLCPVHRKMLIDICRDCGQRLRWIGSDPARCVCSGGDLRRMATRDVTEENARGTATLHGLLGDTRFAAEAEAVRRSVPFADLIDDEIIDFAIRFGKQVLTGRGTFSTEIREKEESDVHLFLKMGFRVAEDWPLNFFGMVVVTSQRSKLVGGRNPKVDDLVVKWLKTLPDERGRKIDAAVTEYRRMTATWKRPGIMGVT